MTNTFLAVVVVAFAAHRLARAVAVDTISDRPRAWVYQRAFMIPIALPDADWGHPGWHDDVERGIIEPPEERVAPAVQTISTPWAYVYSLLSCPFCVGWWLSLVGWVVYAGWHPGRTWFVEAVAVAGAQSIMSAKGM